MTLYNFSVEVYDPELDDWDWLGAVLLPDLALRHHVEHALAVHGVYAPRGLDWVCWAEGAGKPCALILDVSDRPLVRLRLANRRSENGQAHSQ